MTYIVHRLLQAIPVMFLASVPVFLIIHLAEGDPVLMLLGVEATHEAIDAMRARLGLDQPLWKQYWDWISGIMVGDFGRSVMVDFPVATLLKERIPATFTLAVVAISFSIVIAVPLGTAAALRRATWFDHFVTAFTSVAISIPHFWLGILFVLLFSLQLGWLPAGGYVALTDSPSRYLELVLLPALTLSLYISAILTRFIRTSIVEVLLQDYIRTAYAKGLSSISVVIRHALRNALIPAVTVLGVQFGQLLAGTIIVEALFAWPGLGQLMLSAITSRDYPVVQGSFFVFIVIVVLSNLIADVLVSFIDPRISLEGVAK